MTDPSSIQQQLREELLREDPGLIDQKTKYLKFFNDLQQSQPELSQDPLFQQHLKDRLRYHLITQYQPVLQQARRHKFLLYGMPTIALGVALLYIFPFSFPDFSAEESMMKSPWEVVSWGAVLEQETTDLWDEDDSISSYDAWWASDKPTQAAIPAEEINAESFEWNQDNEEDMSAARSMMPMMFSWDNTSSSWSTESPHKKTPSSQIKETAHWKLTYNTTPTEWSENWTLKGILHLKKCNEDFQVSGVLPTLDTNSTQDLEFVSTTHDVFITYHLRTSFESGTIQDIINRESLCQ